MTRSRVRTKCSRPISSSVCSGITKGKERGRETEQQISRFKSVFSVGVRVTVQLLLQKQERLVPGQCTGRELGGWIHCELRNIRSFEIRPLGILTLVWDLAPYESMFNFGKKLPKKSDHGNSKFKPLFHFVKW